LATVGAGHKETLEIQGTYAIVLEVLGRLQEAADVYQQVIIEQTDLFGAAHTTTLLTKMNFGVLCGNTGDVDMQKSLFEQAAQGLTQTLGAQRPHTQAAMRNLARVSDVIHQREANSNVPARSSSGSQMIIRDLQNAKSQHLNGTTVTVQSFDEASKRYVVLLHADQNKQIKLKPENLKDSDEINPTSPWRKLTARRCTSAASNSRRSTATGAAAACQR